MPASMKRMLKSDHMKVPDVGTLPTSGSEGQLLVKLTISPGRSVTVAQAVQKKKAASSLRRAGSGSVFSFMA